MWHGVPLVCTEYFKGTRSWPWAVWEYCSVMWWLEGLSGSWMQGVPSIENRGVSEYNDIMLPMCREKVFIRMVFILMVRSRGFKPSGNCDKDRRNLCIRRCSGVRRISFFQLGCFNTAGRPWCRTSPPPPPPEKKNNRLAEVGVGGGGGGEDSDTFYSFLKNFGIGVYHRTSPTFLTSKQAPPPPQKIGFFFQIQRGCHNLNSLTPHPPRTRLRWGVFCVVMYEGKKQKNTQSWTNEALLGE